MEVEREMNEELQGDRLLVCNLKMRLSVNDTSAWSRDQIRKKVRKESMKLNVWSLLVDLGAE